jgi:ABC-type polysaccharide/polyol phosphate export permease
MASATVEHGFELRGDHGRLRPLLRDLWRSRELIGILARKDFYVRFRRASFGLLWVIGLPLIQATVLAVVLSQFVKFKTGVPFPVYVYSGLLPWSFFIGTVSGGTSAIVQGSSLATKIYFPRAVLPIVSALSGFYAFAPGIPVLFALAAVMGAPITPWLLLMIPATALLFFLATAFGLVFAAMQVYFRDMTLIVQAATLPWFWATGVFFPIARLKPGFRAALEKNPTVGVILLYRRAIGEAVAGWTTAVWWSVGWTVALLIVAALIYRRRDRVFIDLL